jgi:hypothetical protein
LKLLWWCKFEEETFPFLAVWNYRSLTIFGNFLSDLKSSNVDLWNVIWGLYGHEWGLSNHFPPSNPWLNAQLTCVDLSRVSADLAVIRWNPSLYHLRSWFKMISQLIWTLMNDHGAQILQNGHHLLLNDLLDWLTDPPNQFDLVHQLSLHLGRWTMQCYAVNMVNAMT